MHRKTQILLIFSAVFCALFAASGASAARSSTPAEAGLLRAVNATRAAHGLGVLRLDSTLTRAARRHSAEMIQGGYFAHGNFRGRMVAFHVAGPFVGENLAWGSGSYAAAGTVIAEWLNSPAHRANLLRPSFTRVGIGAMQGSFLGNGGSTVFTADFAGR